MAQEGNDYYSRKGARKRPFRACVTYEIFQIEKDLTPPSPASPGGVWPVIAVKVSLSLVGELVRAFPRLFPRRAAAPPALTRRKRTDSRMIGEAGSALGMVEARMGDWELSDRLNLANSRQRDRNRREEKSR